jgi:hypothetical protein
LGGVAWLWTRPELAEIPDGFEPPLTINEASRVAVLPNAPLAARNIPEVSFLLHKQKQKRRAPIQLPRLLGRVLDSWPTPMSRIRASAVCCATWCIREKKSGSQ